MATTIIKVQKPIKSSDRDAPWLIYARGRSNMTQVPDRAIPASVKKAMGKEFRAYFNGIWSSTVGWAINERVADQDW
jgi:hypothetical protein